MKVLDIPKSGRLDELVFYRIGSRQYARRYVVPTLRRTSATGRARGALGALAKAWSKVLTEGQRRAWIAAAEKLQSHPRLDQSGSLPGAQHFIGINSARSAIGREMLREPPAPVVFGLNPVEALSVSEGDEGISLRLSVSGPVVEDIMVFGAAPCSAGRKKCRNVAYLGLLPAPVGGESDITEMYVARYGEPEPGKRVFIRTRQQRNGWEDHHKDTSEVVPAKPAMAARRSGVFDPATTRQLDLPLLLWSRGVGRGGRHAWKLPSSAIAFLPLPLNLGSPDSCRRFPLSPSEGERVGERGPSLPGSSGAQGASNGRGVLSPTPRSAGGAREKPAVAVSKCSRCRGRGGMLLRLHELHGSHGLQRDAVAGRVGTRCTREQYRICTGVSPSQYRPSKRREGGMGCAECEVRNGGLAKVRRNGHWRELWRGG